MTHVIDEAELRLDQHDKAWLDYCTHAREYAEAIDHAQKEQQRVADSVLIAPDTHVTTGSPEWRALVHASHTWQYDTPPDDECYRHYTQTTLCKHHHTQA